MAFLRPLDHDTTAQHKSNGEEGDASEGLSLHLAQIELFIGLLEPGEMLGLVFL